MRSTLALALIAAPLAFASAIQQRAVTDQQFQDAQAALQGFLTNATTALTSGNCSTPCGPYVTSLQNSLLTYSQNCVSTAGSNLTAVGVCACTSSTLSQMSTCGGCINGESAVEQFGEVCKELNGDSSNSTSSASSSASAAASATSGAAAASATSKAASATSAAAAAATSKAASSGTKSYVQGGVVAILASVAGLLVL
ncbi:BZ3500_MvSof-1268-A1-R1_Chr1-1g00872 [Microbotryum saponariae]|uniref:BZ3500_MvSof-1268-A1-R1_Chr1-1g00872 protein n=1 Tax=Microbotryum saponariae TaxID=289078 RepID=A0A2X0L2A7_9BASI|nr:BZ3500_MvSof-1268-A1-R1_Chr1-1g00872 [Microbotryum saponariae]SCZ92821.1 BZ3501_MvSof-1269-A2-R1_Chr1-1g00469 [Microbotryum saponariae]